MGHPPCILPKNDMHSIMLDICKNRLSMVNTLVQAENASSHGFMAGLMREGRALVHAMWFDVRSGDVLYFSRKEKVGKMDNTFETGCKVHCR